MKYLYRWLKCSYKHSPPQQTQIGNQNIYEYNGTAHTRRMVYYPPGYSNRGTMPHNHGWRDQQKTQMEEGRHQDDGTQKTGHKLKIGDLSDGQRDRPLTHIHQHRTCLLAKPHSTVNGEALMNFLLEPGEWHLHPQVTICAYPILNLQIHSVGSPRGMQISFLQYPPTVIQIRSLQDTLQSSGSPLLGSPTVIMISFIGFSIEWYTFALFR